MDNHTLKHRDTVMAGRAEDAGVLPAKGKRECWEPLLAEGKTWEQLTEIWNGDYIFIEEALTLMAPLLGMDAKNVAADYSRLKYHSEKKIDEKIKHHTEKAEQYLKLLDLCDKEESAHPLLSKDEIEAKIDKVNERLAELAVLKEEVKQNGTIYETDVDARMTKTNNHGADICHNVQIAV